MIGAALEAMVAGDGARRQAKALDVSTDVPHTTVGDWRRRFADRAALLAGLRPRSLRRRHVYDAEAFTP